MKLLAFVIPLLAGVVSGLIAGPAVYGAIGGTVAMVALVLITLRGKASAGVHGFAGAVLGVFLAYHLDLWMMDRALNSTVPLVHELGRWQASHGSYPQDISRLHTTAALSKYVTYESSGTSYSLKAWRNGMFLDHWEWRSERGTWELE